MRGGIRIPIRRPPPASADFPSDSGWEIQSEHLIRKPGVSLSRNYKPRMNISSENENFVREGMVFSCVRAGMNFFDLREKALKKHSKSTNLEVAKRTK